MHISEISSTVCLVTYKGVPLWYINLGSASNSHTSSNYMHTNGVEQLKRKVTALPHKSLTRVPNVMRLPVFLVSFHRQEKQTSSEVKQLAQGPEQSRIRAELSLLPTKPWLLTLPCISLHPAQSRKQFSFEEFSNYTIFRFFTNNQEHMVCFIVQFIMYSQSSTMFTHVFSV